MSKPLNAVVKASGVKGPSPGKVVSPCNNPADILKTIGGMPPTKKVEAINAANSPKSAPGASPAGT